MGKRVVGSVLIIGIVFMCCLMFSGCDVQDLIFELVQDPEESQLAVDTNDQTSILVEIQTEIESETETETATETETTAVDLVWAKYELLPYDGIKVHAESAGSNRGIAPVHIIESYEELREVSQSISFGYEADYFETKILILVVFQYATGEEFLDFAGIVIKDGAVCPVITIDSQEDTCDDILYRIMTVEVEKSDVILSAGNILIINTFDPTRASYYHNDRFE